MFENVRVPITEHVLTYACGKMLGGFADMAGIKARTLKSIRHFAKRYCKSIDMKLVLLKSSFFGCERCYPSWNPCGCDIQVFMCGLINIVVELLFTGIKLKGIAFVLYNS